MSRTRADTPGIACVFTLAVAVSATAAGCSAEEEDDAGDEPCTVPFDASYAPTIDPAEFVANVDNPLFPLVPGTVSTFAEGRTKTVEITVLSERKVILGVSCVVVHDVVKE